MLIRASKDLREAVEVVGEVVSVEEEGLVVSRREVAPIRSSTLLLAWTCPAVIRRDVPAGSSQPAEWEDGGDGQPP